MDLCCRLPPNALAIADVLHDLIPVNGLRF